jgi:hypothetical protein
MSSDDIVNDDFDLFIETDEFPPPINEGDQGYDSAEDGFYQIPASTPALAPPPSSRAASRKGSRTSLSTRAASRSPSPLQPGSTAEVDPPRSPSPVRIGASRKRQAGKQGGPPKRYRQPWLPKYVCFVFDCCLLVYLLWRGIIGKKQKHSSKHGSMRSLMIRQKAGWMPSKGQYWRDEWQRRP